MAIVENEKAKSESLKLGFDDAMVRSFVPAVFTAEFRQFTKPSGPVAALGQDFRLNSQEAGTGSRFCGIGAPYRLEKNK